MALEEMDSAHPTFMSAITKTLINISKTIFFGRNADLSSSTDSIARPKSGCRLDAKVAIVMGGATGIGACTARALSENGATVVIADVIPGPRIGENVSFIRCDVSEEDQVRAAVDAVVAVHGRLDVITYCIYSTEEVRSGVLGTAPGELERVLAGAFYVAKHAARVMMPRKKGCIVFAVSACGSRDLVAKYGIIGLVRNLSAELGRHGVRVNCISADGVGVDGSVGKAALYLVSDDANYVNGHNLQLHASTALFA